jgi:starch synthase
VPPSAMSMGLKHKLLLAAPEVVGFAKTGGLADVAGSLPRALANRGHDCAVIMPLYRSIRTGKNPIVRTGHDLTIPIGNKSVQGHLWQSTLPDSDVPVYLLEQPDYYERDDPAQGQGIYQFTLPNGQKRDYSDNCERFIFFSRAVLEALPLVDFWPDVIHLNDWQTGLVAVYLQELYRHLPDYDRIRTLFTIHNIGYQGIFWHWDMLLTGLDWRLFNHKQLEFYGKLNFLKAGIVFADIITTVSPTYAREIQTAQYGCGLEGVLAERHRGLFGIVNGVDYREWNPATDPHLVAAYGVESVGDKKLLCKAALQRRFGLRSQPRAPLLGIVSRLVEQKGLSLLIRTADAILQDDVQLVLLGEGDAVYHRLFLDLRERYPQQVGITLGFDESLAHQIEAGADIFLMPSQYEPSGLNQLYSLKYGTVPVVRATGGLADTITDCTPETLQDRSATGFSFGPFTATAFLETVRKAVDYYRHHPDSWRQLMMTGMQQDWSWDRSAAEYERLYTADKLESTVTR